MKRTAVMLAFALAVGILLGLMIRGEVSSAQHRKSTNLLRTPLTVAEGRDAILDLVEIAPGVTLGKHYHPGEEVFYVLEGSIVVSLDGKGDVPLKRGEALHVPYKRAHSARTTADGVKILVVRIHERGQPERFDVK